MQFRAFASFFVLGYSFYTLNLHVI